MSNVDAFLEKITKIKVIVFDQKMPDSIKNGPFNFKIGQFFWQILIRNGTVWTQKMLLLAQK